MIKPAGIKPQGKTQWLFQAYWLYGAIEPATGESFFCEFSDLDTDCFEAYLTHFSDRYPNDQHIIQVDNAPAHTAKKLVLPENVTLLFQPPHSPDLNPIERLWLWVKEKLGWLTIAKLDELKVKVWEIVKTLKPEEIKQLSYWSFIERAVSAIS